MVQHHEVFTRFQSFYGEIPALCQADFLGTRIRAEFVDGLTVRDEPELSSADYPAPDEEYFEWIDLLESVVSAKECYTMIELGAGFGRWSARAVCAVQQLHSRLSYHMIAVEAEPTVFEWMQLHFSDNGIAQENCSLIHGAVTESDLSVLFYIGGPRGGPFDRHPNSWYGQSLAQHREAQSGRELDGFYSGFPVVRHENGWRSIRVPGVRLSNLLKDRDRVDLIDMDIEGQELPVIRSNIKALDAKVKRVHIGTHGKEIESELRELFRAHHWSCRADYSLHSESETPWGKLRFENGVQSWLNPRLQ
jgi:FkbM family methyltransferase